MSNPCPRHELKQVMPRFNLFIIRVDFYRPKSTYNHGQVRKSNPILLALIFVEANI